MFPSVTPHWVQCLGCPSPCHTTVDATIFVLYHTSTSKTPTYYVRLMHITWLATRLLPFQPHFQSHKFSFSYHDSGNGKVAPVYSLHKPPSGPCISRELTSHWWMSNCGLIIRHLFTLNMSSWHSLTLGVAPSPSPGSSYPLWALNWRWSQYQNLYWLVADNTCIFHPQNRYSFDQHLY